MASSNLSLRNMDEGKIIELVEKLETLTWEVTIQGNKPQGLPNTSNMFEDIWWEIKHCPFCLSELGKAQSRMEMLLAHCTRDTRYKAARECRMALRLLSRRALGEDFGHGADLE